MSSTTAQRLERFLAAALDITPAERLAERLAAPHTPDLWTYQRQRAWLGRITDADRRALQSAADRVLALLADHAWHTADEIRAAAAPSHTGLERLRELRNTHGFNIASRQVAGQCRVWEYRLAEDLPAAGGAG